MGYNSSNDRQSGRRNFGRRDFGGQSRDRQMHKAVCDSCGKDCEVPFRPSGEKPVFCSDCFEKKREGSDSRRFENRNFKKPHFEGRDKSFPQNNEQYDLLNVKLDKILEILNSGSVAREAPTSKNQITKKIKINHEASDDLGIVVQKKEENTKKSLIASKNKKVKK